MKKMDKYEFIRRIDEAKINLPTVSGLVPVLVQKYGYNANRVRNVLKGVTQDDKILNSIEELVKYYTK